jgi:hypothetical protein
MTGRGGRWSPTQWVGHVGPDADPARREIVAVAERLNAFTEPKLRVNRLTKLWYRLGLGLNRTDMVVGNNQMFLYPFFLDERTTVSQLGIVCTTTGGGAATADLAIYAADESTYLPVGPPQGAVTGVTLNATGVRKGNVAMTLEPGMYWAGFRASLNGSSPEVRRWEAIDFMYGGVPEASIGTAREQAVLFLSGQTSLPTLSGSTTFDRTLVSAPTLWGELEVA